MDFAPSEEAERWRYLYKVEVGGSSGAAAQFGIAALGRFVSGYNAAQG